MHLKSFKMSQRHMKFLETMIKELSMIPMELLESSLVEWVEDREDSEAILTQRNYLEQYLGTKAHLLEISATLVVVVVARQSSLTLAPRSIMLTLPSSKQHRECRRTCSWASWTPATSVKVCYHLSSHDVLSDLSVQELGVSQDLSQRDVQHAMELVWKQSQQVLLWWGPPAGGCVVWPPEFLNSRLLLGDALARAVIIRTHVESVEVLDRLIRDRRFG